MQNAKMINAIKNAFSTGYVQGMSDLLSPILILMGAEDVAFWCFAGLMDRVVSFRLILKLFVHMIYLHMILRCSEIFWKLWQ